MAKSSLDAFNVVVVPDFPKNTVGLHTPGKTRIVEDREGKRGVIRIKEPQVTITKFRSTNE